MKLFMIPYDFSYVEWASIRSGVEWASIRSGVPRGKNFKRKTKIKRIFR